jgi:hypothetical protein
MTCSNDSEPACPSYNWSFPWSSRTCIPHVVADHGCVLYSRWGITRPVSREDGAGKHFRKLWSIRISSSIGLVGSESRRRCSGVSDLPAECPRGHHTTVRL